MYVFSLRTRKVFQNKNKAKQKQKNADFVKSRFLSFSPRFLICEIFQTKRYERPNASTAFRNRAAQSIFTL
jgi:hypothetical protein